MYLALMLDDEHYTDLYYESCETEVEGFDIFKKWNNEDYGEYYEEGNRFVWTDDFDCEQHFAVCEVYELNDKPYVLIWWHAYNGVDFSVKQFDTFEEANAAMRAEADNIYIYIDDAYENETITPDSWSGIVDDGVEWNCWEIVERSEL